MLSNLSGKKIILGVTGGIAVYKACELARLFKKNGAEVRVVMTEAAVEFVAPLTFETLTNEPVHSQMFEKARNTSVEHIALSRWADLIVVAPATANTLAKISAGMADNLLTTVVLSRRPAVPLLVAPAMNVEMWQSPLT